MFRKDHQVISVFQCLDTFPERHSQLHRRIPVYRNGIQPAHDIHTEPAHEPGQKPANEYGQEGFLAEGVLIQIGPDILGSSHHVGNNPESDRHRKTQCTCNRSVYLGMVAEKNQRVFTVLPDMIQIDHFMSVERPENTDDDFRNQLFFHPCLFLNQDIRAVHILLSHSVIFFSVCFQEDHTKYSRNGNYNNHCRVDQQFVPGSPVQGEFQTDHSASNQRKADQ